MPLPVVLPDRRATIFFRIREAREAVLVAFGVPSPAMYLSAISLTDFKNYARQELSFRPGLNCIVGENGEGKTNLLEAIYYLCMGKSHANTPDRYLVRHETDGSRLVGVFQEGEVRKDTIVVKLRKGKRKVLERNGVAYERIADHVGRYPVVLIVPDDSELVTGGSEIRRRLLDNSLSQSDPDYLNHLLAYNRLMASRNALLKAREGRPDTSGLLEIYGQQMAAPAQYIHEKRQAFIEPFGKWLLDTHATISGEKESVAVTYKSQLATQSWSELLAERQEKDRILQRTTGGVHRDDLVFFQGGHPLRRVASQGQLKSFVLALKLAQYHLLQQTTGQTPILLLDDIFDKLDRQRVGQLLQLVLGSTFGQVFLSDTDPERVVSLLKADQQHWQRLRVVQGSVTEG